MSIKEELLKMEKEKMKKIKEKGEGFIKVEVKDGTIEASSNLKMSGKVLLMALIILETLQRSIVENDSELKSVFKKLRNLSDDEIVKLISENSLMVKGNQDDSDKGK